MEYKYLHLVVLERNENAKINKNHNLYSMTFIYF